MNPSAPLWVVVTQVNLAVASRSLGEVFGPAVVAPFLDAYGLDDVDLRRLDTHQLLDHLLT